VHWPVSALVEIKDVERARTLREKLLSNDVSPSELHADHTGVHTGRLLGDC
jgi:hypothetical protein